MAGELKFPIGFDLDAGIDAAAQEWNNTGAKKLEDKLSKKPVKVKLTISGKDIKLDKFEEVKKKLEELKIEPLSPEVKKDLRDLTKELNALARALSGLRGLSGVRTADWQAADAEYKRKQAATADERLRLQQERLTLQQMRSVDAINRQNAAYKAQGGYINRLIKRMAVYASAQSLIGLAKQLKEVTAQFELQRVSLGAILGDTAQANLLFGQLKQQALESPVTLMDLTKYTKQLAAYKIETDELFETTKRLTDISVGLGVAMDRVVLAFGQVRASGHLRASEVRQFTEMGIPIVESLAQKLSLMNNELVTAADVMRMISERAISFNLVNEVLKDMTSEGGMFAGIQEKQTNTLYGLYAKVADAFQIMLAEIGEAGAVNSILRGIGEAALFLMERVEGLTGTVLSSIGIFSAYKLIWGKIIPLWKGAGAAHAAALRNSIAATTKLSTAQLRLTESETAVSLAESQLNSIRATGTQRAIQAAEADLALAQQRHQLAQENIRLAQSEQASAQKKLRWTPKSGIGAVAKSLGFTVLWGALIAGVMAGLTALFNWIDKTYGALDRMKKKLKEIEEEAHKTADEGSKNFERLAKTATEAADGSDKQRKALEELQRTYGDILPSQTLQIDKLREMRGGYEELTAAIKENAYAQAQAQALAEVETTYSEKIRDAQDDLEDGLENAITSGALASESAQKRVVENIIAAAKAHQGELSYAAYEDIVEEALALEGINRDSNYYAWSKVIQADGYYALRKTLLDYNKEINRVNKQYRAYTGNIGKYTDMFKKDLEAAAEMTDPVEKAKKVMETLLQFSKVGTDYIANFKDSVDFRSEGFWDMIAEAVGDDAALNKLMKETRRQINKIFPEESEFTRVINRYADMIDKALDFQGGMNLRINSNENEEAYVKRLNEMIEEKTQTRDKDYETRRNGLALDGNSTAALDEDIARLDKQIAWAKKMLTFLNSYDKDKKKSGGSQKDPWIELLHQRIKFMEDFQKGVEELNKTMPYEGALFSTQETMRARGMELGIGVDDLVGDENELIAYYDKQIAALKGKLAETGKEFANIEGLSVYEILATDTKSKQAMAYQTEIAKVFAQQTDFIHKQQLANMRRALARLSEDVSRSKEAKDFYDKIFAQTGDAELAQTITTSIHGHLAGEDAAKALYEAQKAEIEAVFKSKEASAPIDLSGVFDEKNMRISYLKLSAIYDEFSEQIIEQNRSTAEAIAKNGKKASATEIAELMKTLDKAKDIETRRTDIIKTAAAERARIYRSELPQEVKEQLISQSREKERQDLANLSVEELKGSEDYVRIFQDLNKVSKGSLKRLRGEIELLAKSSKDMSPENMKAMAKALDDIDNALDGRGFGNAAIKGIKEWIKAFKEYRKALVEYKQAQAEFDANKGGYDTAISDADAQVTSAQAAKAAADTKLATLIQTGASEAEITEAVNEQVAAALVLVEAETAQANAVNAKAKAEKKVEKAKTKQSNAADKMRESEQRIMEDMNKTADTAEQLAKILEDIKELFGIAEDSVAGLAFDSAVKGLQQMASVLQLVTTLQTFFNAVCNSNPWMAVGAAVLAGVLALGNFLKGQSIKEAQDIIDEQEKKLKRLELAYERLEKAAEKAFGADYIRAYNQQLANLQSQVLAYEKQLEAERSKGKSADEEAIEGYQDSLRETREQIADMSAMVSERMLGTDLTSAARDFASAWLDARLSFENTADAMSGKAKDMLQNMMIEGLLSKVMEQALAPAFEMINNMSGGDFYKESFWAKVSAQAKASAEAADAGAQSMMTWLEKMGMSMSDMNSDASGIAKNVSAASSEEINAVAAGLNTQNYYLSYVPQIYVLLAKQSGSSVSTSADTTALQTQAMTQRAAIEANTAATVRELQGLATLLSRVIAYKGGGYGVRTLI